VPSRARSIQARPHRQSLFTLLRPLRGGVTCIPSLDMDSRISPQPRRQSRGQPRSRPADSGIRCIRSPRPVATESHCRRCPGCSALLREEDEICATCGLRLTPPAPGSVEERALRAAHGSRTGKRGRAIRTLGGARSAAALKALETILTESDDEEETCDALRALSEYPTEVRLSWYRAMIAHPSPTVGILGRLLLIDAESKAEKERKS